MKVWNEEEEQILQKMEAKSFPASVTTTVIWATREATNPEDARAEVEALLDKQATAREMVKLDFIAYLLPQRLYVHIFQSDRVCIIDNIHNMSSLVFCLSSQIYPVPASFSAAFT